MSRELRTYTFTAAVEPADEGMWHAYCPTLLAYGAATWGTTREEVLAHIGEMGTLGARGIGPAGANQPWGGGSCRRPRGQGSVPPKSSSPGGSRAGLRPRTA